MSVVHARSGVPDDRVGEIARLREELAVARLRLQVALAVADPLADHVTEYADQMLVVDEVVRRWRALDAREQAGYQVLGSPFAPLVWYAWRYIDAVNGEPFDPVDGEPRDRANGEPGDRGPDDVLHRHWRRHLAGLRTSR